MLTDDVEVMRRLIEEAWQLAEKLADQYQDEWCKPDQNIPLMKRLVRMYRTADDRYWRRADALMAMLPAQD